MEHKSRYTPLIGSCCCPCPILSQNWTWWVQTNHYLHCPDIAAKLERVIHRRDMMLDVKCISRRERESKICAFFPPSASSPPIAVASSTRIPG